MQQNNGLDRNQLISFAIFSAILMAFMFYFQKKQIKKEETEQVKTEKIVKLNSVKPTVATNLNTNVTPNSIQKVNLKDDLLSLEFASLGGQLSSVKFNKYFAYNEKTKKTDKPLYLFSNNNASYGFQFKDKTGKIINTKDLVFTPQVSGNTVTLTSNFNGALIQFIYTLLPKYTIDFKVKSQGLAQLVTDGKANFVWDYQVRSAEKGRSQEQTHSEFAYSFNNYKDYDYDASKEMDEPEETLNWIGIKQQFFTALIEAKNGFTQSKGSQEMIEKGEFLKKFDFNGTIAMNGNELNQDFTWYFMPLDLPLLKKYNKNFDEIVPLGWSFIGATNRWLLLPLYDFLAKWGITAGWVIFLMTIIIKLVLSPIMFKQHKLSAMMRVIRPEIDAVNEKYKNADAMKKQQETMAVYKKAGVNQMAGCLPALVQIPIFYALFRLFPNMINLRGKSFWFANDLTAYDDVIKLPFNVPFVGEHISIFAILCTIVILIYTIMTSGNMQQPDTPGMPNMKVMMYIFPVTFFFFLNTSASGLSWYYFVSNALNILIILAIKYWILDEKKIHAQIQANKAAPPKKEGNFQRRMREMMEKAQEQQKLQEQQKNKK